MLLLSITLTITIIVNFLFLPTFYILTPIKLTWIAASLGPIGLDPLGLIATNGPPKDCSLFHWKFEILSS